jgi:hypothetical protein
MKRVPHTPRIEFFVNGKKFDPSSTANVPKEVLADFLRRSHSLDVSYSPRVRQAIQEIAEANGRRLRAIEAIASGQRSGARGRISQGPRRSCEARDEKLLKAWRESGGKITRAATIAHDLGWRPPERWKDDGCPSTYAKAVLNPEWLKRFRDEVRHARERSQSRKVANAT